MSSVLREAYLYAKKRGLIDNPYEGAIYELMEIRRDGTTALGAKAEADLPKRVDRGNNILPNFIVEGPQAVGANGAERFNAYWIATHHILSKCGHMREAEIVMMFMVEFPKLGVSVDMKTSWVVPSIEGVSLLDMAGVREMWEDLWGKVVSDQTSYENWYQAAGFEKARAFEPSVCLVTGRRCAIARIHGRVMGVPGTGGKASMTSFGERSYQYRGRQEGDNYPIAKSVSLGYTSAFTHMLSDGVGSVVTGDTSAFLIWSSNPEDDVGSLTKVLSRYSSKKDRAEAGERLKEMVGSQSTLFVMSVKGSTGRISITGWDQVTLGSAAASVIRFTKMLGIRGYAVGGTLSRASSSKKGISTQTTVATIRAALCSQPIPESLAKDLADSLDAPLAEYDIGVETKVNMSEGIIQWNA